MGRNDVAKATTVLLLVLLYSLPFIAILIYTLVNISVPTVFDREQSVPVIALTLANGQEVLLAGVQRLIVPLIAGLSVLWLGQADQPPPEAAPAALPAVLPATPPASSFVERFRFALLLFAVAMIVVVVWDYIVIENWSNFEPVEDARVKGELLQFHQSAIENYLVIVAIVLGINLSK